MHRKTILQFVIGIFLSGSLKSQQNNSFNFQSDGANGDFVTVSSDTLIQPTTGMTLEAWVKPTEDPSTYNMNGIIILYVVRPAAGGHVMVINIIKKKTIHNLLPLFYNGHNKIGIKIY